MNDKLFYDNKAFTTTKSISDFIIFSKKQIVGFSKNLRYIHNILEEEKNAAFNTFSQNVSKNVKNMIMSSTYEYWRNESGLKSIFEKEEKKINKLLQDKKELYNDTLEKLNEVEAKKETYYTMTIETLKDCKVDFERDLISLIEELWKNHLIYSKKTSYDSLDLEDILFVHNFVHNNTLKDYDFEHLKTNLYHLYSTFNAFKFDDFIDDLSSDENYFLKIFNRYHTNKNRILFLYSQRNNISKKEIVNNINCFFEKIENLKKTCREYWNTDLAIDHLTHEKNKLERFLEENKINKKKLLKKICKIVIEEEKQFLNFLYDNKEVVKNLEYYSTLSKHFKKIEDILVDIDSLKKNSERIEYFILSEINLLYKNKKYNFEDVYSVFISGWEETDRNIKYLKDFLEKISKDISIVDTYTPLVLSEYKNKNERKKDEIKKQIFEKLKNS